MNVFSRLAESLLVLGGVLIVQPLAAQETRPEASPALTIEFTNWQLDMGAWSSGSRAPALQGVTARIAMRVPGVGCTSDPRCFFEGFSYHTGTYSMTHAGVALLVPLSGHLGLRAGLDLVKPFGDGAGDLAMYRFGLAATWKFR